MRRVIAWPMGVAGGVLWHLGLWLGSVMAGLVVPALLLSGLAMPFASAGSRRYWLDAAWWTVRVALVLVTAIAVGAALRRLHATLRTERAAGGGSAASRGRAA